MALNASQRSRTSGVAASLLAHVVILAFLASATHRATVPEPVRTTDLQLVRDWPTMSRRKASAPVRSAAASRAPSRLADTPPLPILEARPAATPVPSLPPSPAPDDGERRGLTSALRGSVGCAQARFNDLSAVEQQRCRDRFATAAEGIHDDARLGIDPIKRAAFDASWQADHGPQHMAGMACAAVFGKGGLKWLHPSEGVKLGPLPCYVYTPKATFATDPEHSRGW